MTGIHIAAVATADDIVVQVDVTNTANVPYRLLKWNLPSNGRLEHPVFTVQRDGVDVTYTGIMVKRAVSQSDYFTIDPACVCSVRIPLAQAYDVKPRGEYRIQYRVMNQQAEGIDQLSSNVIVVGKH